MNEYQLLDLFNSFLDTTFTFLVSYISGTSAFLAVAYIVGKKLPLFVAGLIITLYSMASLFFLIAFQRNWAALISIREQMVDANLAWMPAVSEPQILIPFVMWLGVIVMIVLYAGSVWYLLSVRRGGDDRDT